MLTAVARPKEDLERDPWRKCYKVCMQARIKDIAKCLHLSASTVQSILSNKPGFRETTRQRVLNKAKELNYRPNLVARSLATQKTHVCGVVVPNLSRSIFPDILEGIDAVTHAAGYHLVVCSTGEDPEREEEEIGALIEKQVDGLIVASARRPGKNGRWEMPEKPRAPLVLVDRQFTGPPFIGADHERIGLIATRHLIEQGYRAIAHLSRRNVVTGVGRCRGYVRALHDAGMRARRDFILDVQNEAGGYEGAMQLLQLNPRPDAIFAAGDSIAIGAMRAIQDSGLRMPTDFGIIGVGRIQYTEYLRVPLSTVDQHSVAAGKAAASILLRMIDGEAAPSAPALLEPTLVVRDSSCRIPTAETNPIRLRKIYRESASEVTEERC
jgi:LacI family transcriptional regulator, galactose operon repressor